MSIASLSGTLPDPRPQRKGRGRAKATLDMIDAMIRIGAEIQPCSVRAIAYQMFNRKLIKSMGKGDVAKISNLSVIARESGSLPWKWIVDDSRREQQESTWDDPAEYASAVQDCYRKNKWEPQPNHVVVWSEKATVEGTLGPVLKKYEVPYRFIHGWAGATPVWDAAQATLDRSKRTVLLYVGDYDPSGMGMSEVDLPKRLARYMSNDPSDKKLSPETIRGILSETQLEIRRIALTAEDTVNLGAGPRFDASDKKSDSRYKWFVQNYGHGCWELDAMSPTVLRGRVESAIRAEIDFDLWDRYTAIEETERAAIIDLCNQWKSILHQDHK